MIKKYIMVMAVLLAILIFTSTSNASFLPSRIIYERFPENSALKNILNRLSQVISNNNDIVSNDVDEDDGVSIDIDEDDGEYDDDDSEDGPKEDVLLPNVLEEGFYWTPDGGNEPVDNSEETSTVDSDGKDGVTQDDEWTVDSDGDEGAASNEITVPDYIAEGEWTVRQFVKTVTERNVKLGGMLQRVVERTTFAPGTTESGGTAENDIVDVVVEGGSMGTPGADIDDVIVLTDGGQ